MVNKAQSIIDGKNKQSRRISEKWNQVVNTHRSIMYEKREAILTASPKDLMQYLKVKVIPDYAEFLVKNKSVEEIECLVGHLIDVQKCFSKNSKNFEDNLKRELFLSWKKTVINKNKEESEKYIKDLRVKMLKVLDDYWTSEMERLEDLKREASMALASDDPFKRYEYAAAKEFANGLMPAVMNEFITYSVQPDLQYGKYVIKELPLEEEQEYVR